MNIKISPRIQNFLKKCRRWIFSVFLVVVICEMIFYSVGLIIESTGADEASWLLKDLNRGDYADCAEYYTTLLHLGKADGEEFAPYAEFEEFYGEYVLCVEYAGAKEPDKYQESMDESIANMNRIYENTMYNDNIPHYEYLLEHIQEIKGNISKE